MPTLLAASIACLFTLVSLSGCSPDGSSPGVVTTLDPGSSSATTVLSGMAPEEIASEAVATWAAVMKALVAILEKGPQADVAREEVEHLRDTYAEKLLALGHLRETLSEGDRAKVSADIAAGLDTMADEPWFERYVDLYEGYAEGNPDFVDLLASFNILIRYADFDLLRQQSPEEAALLGIDQP